MLRGCTTADENAAQILRKGEYTVKCGLIFRRVSMTLWLTTANENTVKAPSRHTIVGAALCGRPKCGG